jgi:hypothetical protein
VEHLTYAVFVVYPWLGCFCGEAALINKTNGRIYRAATLARGLGEPQMLFDANGLRFEAIPPPYCVIFENGR